MTSLDAGSNSVGIATSTPRVDRLSSSQGARSKLMTRVNQRSLSSPVSETEMHESDLDTSMSSQISDLEQVLQDLTTDYERCKHELEKTLRQRRHVSFAEGNDRDRQASQNKVVRETVTPLDRVKETESLSTSPAQINFAQRDRSENLSRSQTNMSTLPSTPENLGRPKRREKEPDKFDGRNVAWQDYFVHFEQVSDWNNWSYEEKSQQLVMSLRGEAQKILGDLSQEQRKDYDNLKSILSSRFCPKELVVAHRVDFRSRLRKQNESPSDYGFALRRLGNLAFPDMAYSDREIVILEQFMSGIGNSEIRSHVILHHPKTLESAISLATEFEAVKGPQLFITKPSVNSVKTENEDTHVKTSDELSSLVQTLEKCVNKIANSYRGGRKQTGKVIECYKCQQLGHIARNCHSHNTSARVEKDNTSPSHTPSVRDQENLPGLHSKPTV
ncbi:uncharacterized protein LOC133191598 [Saccostrea echinata]|uniref:uncharacterized protein LOC133191598 n=1 Tax=Saccostrea echinata TaxID=191078 RepID=UPI002A825363|nr:uncharacterized protein LOC133191598 [Saccostrea echinata]